MRRHVKQLIKQNKVFYTGYGLFISSGLLLLGLVGKDQLFLQMNNWQLTFADALAPWLTHLGDGLFALLFLFVFALFNYRLAFTALLCFVSVLLITQVGKQFIFDDALRPFAYFEAKGQAIRTIAGVKVHAHNSFPSGHSASVFALFSFFALRLNNKQWGLPLLLVAVLIAYTRVHIAQHFFGDVLAGSLVGVLSVLTITAALDAYYERHPAAWHQKGLLVK
jgi:membrane-associated phospholipid phosphatase